MKYLIGFLFIASLGSIIAGYIIDADYSQKLIGFGVVGLLVALSFIGLLLWCAFRASREMQPAILWASLFLIQVLFIKIQLANPSLWLLSALIWMTASKWSVLSNQSSVTEH